MNWILANPHGLWALLGIPALILIHFLQRRSQSVPVSTLFLLEQTELESAAGKRFQNFTRSIPFWLQILAVLLMTWLLAQPRILRANSTQQIAIVLDSSASMQVFQKSIPEILEKQLPTMAGLAKRVEFIVLETNPKRPRIYRGHNFSELKKALLSWKPDQGTTNPGTTLRIARGLVEAEGLLVYLTDTPTEYLPFRASLISIGTPVENCGFTGITYEQKEGAQIWRTLLRNYSDQPQTRQWYLETPDRKRTSPREISLNPGQMIPLQGKFPEGTDFATLRVTPDRFTLDDSLALIRPAPKTLNFLQTTSEKYLPLGQKLLTGLEQLKPAEDSAEIDLALMIVSPDLAELSPLTSVVMLDENTEPGSYYRGRIVAEKHPLMDGLSWQPLLARKTRALTHQADDEVLLWQGENALIFLREQKQLIFNFDLTLSNALKLPATAVLLHRFCESLKAQKIGPESRSLDTSQMIELTAEPEKTLLLKNRNLDGSSTETESQSSTFQTSSAPGFLTVSQNDRPLLSAAVNFADTREADFSQCAKINTLQEAGATAVERHTREDSYWRLWLLLLLGIILAFYKLT